MDNVNQVTISNSVFTQSFNDSCSTIVDNTDGRYFLNNTIFFFINNVISNYTCYHDYTQYTEFVKIARSNYNNVTFANNIIENISFREHGNITLLLFALFGGFYSGSLVIRNNSFVHINYSDVIISFGDSNRASFAIEYTIELNNFSSIFVGTSIMKIFSRVYVTTFDINRNQFVNNERIALILFSCLGCLCQPSVAVVSIDELTLINNTFDVQIPITIQSSSISIQHVYAERNYVHSKLHKAAIIILGFDCISVVIQVSNLTFTNNTVNSIIALSSALIAISGAQTAMIANVTFKNNFGTPISINPYRSKDQTDLLVAGTLLFIGNTGIHGGACSFYYVHIMNKDIPSANMTFLDNFAIYGGALYNLLLMRGMVLLL